MSVANELFEKHKNELDEFQAWIKAESKLPQNIGEQLNYNQIIRVQISIVVEFLQFFFT